MKICTTGDDLSAARWVADDYASQEGETLREAGARVEIIGALRAEADRRVDEVTAPGASSPIDVINRKLNMIMGFCQIIDRAQQGQPVAGDSQKLEYLRAKGATVEAIRTIEAQKSAAFLAYGPINLNEGWPTQ